MSERADSRRLTGDAVPGPEPPFRELAEQLPALLWACDPDGTVDYLSPRWNEYSGLPAADLLGPARRDLIHPEDRPAVERAWESARSEEIPFQMQFRLRRHDGAWRWFQAQAQPVRDDAGRIVRWVGATTDIEPQKRAELRQRLLSEAAALLLAADDPQAMMHQLFDRVREHLEVDTYFNFMVDLPGETLRLASYAGIPEDVARQIERLEFGQAICGNVAMNRQAVIATAIQDSDDPRVQLVKSFGIRTYACRPLLDKGRLIGTLSFASRTRDSFNEDEIEFMRTITRYVELAHERLALVHELKEADRRKDEFLATLSHELRNPLAPLRHSLEVMRLAAHDTATVENARSVMERQLGQMVRLIDDLLDVSRISSGKITLRKTRLDFLPLLRNAIEMNRPFIEACGHVLETDLPTVPIRLDADGTRLTQVFDNLLNNAAKYTDRGGRIRVAVERQPAEVVVAVQDSGIGIPKPMLGRVFDMFAQIDHTLERAQGGLGLGLNIVKRLVEKHGGTVVAKSDGAGRGSTFVVRLPLPADEDPPEAATEAVAGPAAGGRRKVLVVDDNKDAALTLTMMLELMGSETRVAYDGHGALASAEEFRPDLVLLDIGMPGLNGYDTARRIREQPWGSAMVLVALTGWGQDEDRQRSREAGFDDHVVKPIEPAALERLLSLRPAS